MNHQHNLRTHTFVRSSFALGGAFDSRTHTPRTPPPSPIPQKYHKSCSPLAHRLSALASLAQNVVIRNFASVKSPLRGQTRTYLDGGRGEGQVHIYGLSVCLRMRGCPLFQARIAQRQLDPANLVMRRNARNCGARCCLLLIWCVR